VIAAGADACLTKPFEFSDVNRKLDQLLGLPEHIGVLSTDRSR
jgi:hypothetical protein